MSDQRSFGLDNAKKDSAVPRRLLLATTSLTALGLTLSIGATQFLAWRLNYHWALGQPWFGRFYAPWSWWTWANASWSARVWNEFELVKGGAYAVGALIAIVVFVTLNRMRHKPLKHENIHGSAKFGTLENLKAAGLIPSNPGEPQNGVYVGAWEDDDGNLHYLCHNGPEHVLGSGPTRSGKGLGLGIPTLLTWPDSVVTYDEKGEQWEMTSGWRNVEANNRVLRWAPGEAANSVSFNFLDEVRLGTEFEFRDIANIMEMIADPDGNGMDKHWDPSAAEALNGVGLHVCYEKKILGQQANLGDVLHALSDPQRDQNELYLSMQGNHHLNGTPHPQIAAIGQTMLNKDVRERSGIHSTATRMLRLFRDPIVVRNTFSSDFTIHDLMNDDKPVSLYIITRGEDKLRLRSLVRLFITMMFNRLLSAELNMISGRQIMPHKRRLLVMLDELPSLGKMEIIPESMSKCAGFGIKVYPLIQDREQLLEAYGAHETITSHCHIKSAYAPTSWATAKWMSDMAGITTVNVASVTESGAKGSTLQNVSRTYHQIQRPLVTPDEAMRLKAPLKDKNGLITEPGQVLVYVSGHPVVLGTQSLYFRDPEFVRRVSMQAPRFMAP